MKRDLLIAGVVWLVVTAASLLGAAVMDPFPTAGADAAKTVDDAFRVMTFMAAPVFGLVIAGLVTSIVSHRWRGPTQDGESIRGTNAVPKIWFGATTVLAVVVMIYPGLTGLAELRKDQTADLQVNVTGQRWMWIVQYPTQGVTISGASEIVLPRGERVQFNVTAPVGDVLHSFWIPAFRLKLDAVPGQTGRLFLTPTELGDGGTDTAYRLQCAELCGLQHANMVTPVRVVERDEFDRWVAARKAGN
jgi:cytochrome c oxidase subunit 2